MFTRIKDEATRLKQTRLQSLLESDAGRAEEFALGCGEIHASFARQHYDQAALQALFALAEAGKLKSALQDLMGGAQVNPTEQRAALHTALRGASSGERRACDAHADASAALDKMALLVEAIEADPAITDVVSIGIGGSDLGPRLVVDALRSANPRLRVHFVSNVDGTAIARTLAGLVPEHTCGIVISKTFGTQETLLNGAVLREWLGNDARLYAVTCNAERAARALGIAAERSLPMWEWVGGRYSLWSAVGFPAALAIGMPAFRALLAGAAAFDRHALEAPIESNLAIWHALTAIWNRNGLGATSQAVLPYDQRLALLPAYLQQLVMESLGKQVTLDGQRVAEMTCPVWWGGVGSDCQHSFFQALHQGTDIIPAEFIGVMKADHPHADNHAALLSNLLAQSEALANGAASDDPHRNYPGGRPSTVLLLERLTPEALGQLLALYEHSVYLQSVLWNINAFDQFGVELGKQVANRLMPALAGEVVAEDPVTRQLIARLREAGAGPG